MPLCEGKKRYPTNVVAVLVAMKRMRGENAPEALRTYRCPVCKGWHLTKAVSESDSYVVRKS